MSTENSNQESKSNEFYTVLECVFCKGTGIAKCFDFSDNNDLPKGSYYLNTLIKEKGTYAPCPDGCRVMN